jgi:hypothetical protein
VLRTSKKPARAKKRAAGFRRDWARVTRGRLQLARPVQA